MNASVLTLEYFPCSRRRPQVRRVLAGDDARTDAHRHHGGLVAEAEAGAQPVVAMLTTMMTVSGRQISG